MKSTFELQKETKGFKEFTFEKTESKNIPFDPPENNEIEDVIEMTQSY